MFLCGLLEMGWGMLGVMRWDDFSFGAIAAVYLYRLVILKVEGCKG